MANQNSDIVNPETFIIYTLPNVMMAYAAKSQTTGKWYFMPSSRDGWALRREWHPHRGFERLTELDREIAFFGLPWLAEMSIGIPAGLVAQGLTERHRTALDAEVKRFGVSA